MTPARAEIVIPNNLWQGLIAEDTSGNYNTYLAIASVVRNRLNAGMDNGLVALKRKHFEHFVKREIIWASWNDIDLTGASMSAIQEVFEEGKDYANGATHYEHTKRYGYPSWSKNMVIVKIMFKNLPNEITFFK